jgi:two-component system, NtrC family, sensor kinase
VKFLEEHPVKPGVGVTGRVASFGAVVHIPDVLADPSYNFSGAAYAGQFRAALGVPLLRKGKVEGVFALGRPDPKPFTDRQIELVQTFADQAVIAIENTHLFNELRQRTTDLTERTTDLTEALEQQTATSEVLRVISSSPGDLQPVFQAMLEKAVRICDASQGNIYHWDGTVFDLLATDNTPPALAEARRLSPLRPGRTDPLGRMVATNALVHIADLTTEKDYIERTRPVMVAAVERWGVRTLMAVPMLKDYGSGVNCHIGPSTHRPR